MNSLEQLSKVFTGAVWAVTILLGIMFIYRLFRGSLKPAERQSWRAVPKAYYPKFIKLAFAMSMLLAIIWAPIYAYIGSAFKSMIPAYLNHLLVIVTILLALQECYLGFSISRKLIEKSYKRVVLSVVALIMLPWSIYLMAYIPDLFTYPEAEECYVLDLPFDGTWMAGHAGGSEIINYHCAVEAQQFAMDVVKLNESGGFYSGKGNQPKDFATFGASILAPVSGTVVQVVDSVEDIDINLQVLDTLNPAGNHVVIEFEPDRYVFLAHLNKGSIVVHVGDEVTSGQQVAKAGNSGNTTWPHLHMHIQDLPYIDNKNATGYPYVFRSMMRKRWMGWTQVENEFLIRNDRFRKVN